MTEEEYVRRLRAINAELDALTVHEAGLATERRVLLRALYGAYGWSQHELARVLGLSQPRVCSILNGKKRTGRRK